MCQSVLKFCIQNLLPKQQEDTLFFFLDVIRDVLAESHSSNHEDLEKLKQDLNTAIALLE